jgi:hypothetical protein
MFCWLILQNKLWTTYTVVKHDGQANQICQLCRTKKESALHMLAQCSYSKSVWSGLAQWIGTQLQPSPTRSYRHFKTWWHSMMRAGQQQQDVNRAQRVIYTSWNIWKERCKRVFENKVTTPTQLINIIKDDVQQWIIAWRDDTKE